MPTAHARYCLDTIGISVIASSTLMGCEAEIEVPGDFPLEVANGAMYRIGFTYVTGQGPSYTGFDLSWLVRDPEGNFYTNEAKPTGKITPEAPVQNTDLCGMKSGMVAGIVPTLSPTTDNPRIARLYQAVLRILP